MKIEHIAIWTRDIQLLKSFYVRYFEGRANAKYYNQKRLFESCFIDFSGETRLELMQMPDIPDNKNNPFDQYKGIIHLAFSVGSRGRVDILTARLERDGYIVISPPRETGDGYYESTVLDPEGNRIEITS